MHTNIRQFPESTDATAAESVKKVAKSVIRIGGDLETVGENGIFSLFSAIFRVENTPPHKNFYLTL